MNRRRKFQLFAVLAALMFVLSPEGAWAQATAQINGTVTDQSGALLPGVEVTSTQVDTGIVRTTLTNETGSYALPNLAIGPYRLEATLPGFQTYVQTGIVLAVNSNPVINLSLAVGQVAQTIEVIASAALVETRNVGISSFIENQQILELPLNGRNVAELVLLAGGAVKTGASQGDSKAMPGGVDISVSGGVSGGNFNSTGYFLDGSIFTNKWDNSNLPLPFPDALQEFKVETSALTAKNGMQSGAMVSAVTKSGTNEFHGNLFEFVRNGKFNARNFFANERDSLKRNQFGGTAGGPILQNKLFFFTGVQATRTRSDGVTFIDTIPTADMIAGDFTTITSPACSGRQITLKAPFENNRIDPALFSPAGLNLVNRLPTTTDPCGDITYRTQGKPNELQLLGRLDYEWTDSHSVFGRYMATTYVVPAPFELDDTNILVTGKRAKDIGGKDNLAQAFTFGSTYLFGSNIVNSFRLTGNRTAIQRIAPPVLDGHDLGIQDYFTYIDDQISMRITGGFGISRDYTAPFITATLALMDDVSFVRGDHQLAFGANLMHVETNAPNFKFGPGDLRITGESTGLGLADLLMGNFASWVQAPPFVLASRQWQMGFYAQDTWRATPRVTLNYGLRWEPFLPIQNVNGRINHFDIDNFRQGIRTTQYPGAPAGLVYPGDPGFPRQGGMNRQWWNLAPRVGIAWDVNGDGRTSVRAGYGIANEFASGGLHLGTVIVPPWSGRVQINDGSLDNPYKDYPGGNPFPAGPDGLFSLFALNATFDYDTKTPYVNQWNLSIQRQVGADWLASANYVGSQTIHMWMNKQVNPATFFPGGPCTLTDGKTYDPCSTRGNIDRRRKLILEDFEQGQFYSFLTSIDDGGTGSYHGLQLSLQRRVSSGVSLSGNYTWSHCIGVKAMGSVNPGVDYLDPNNRDLDRGNCLSDRRHIMNLTTVAETPEFANRTLNAVASGWRLSTIFRRSTGAWLTVLSGVDRAMDGNRSHRPDQVLENPYGDRSALSNYLNPAAFANPASGTLGSMGAANVEGPGTWGLDVALSRLFQIGETQRLELRAEAFNATNSLRRANPDTTLRSNRFGRITTALDPRIMQFALKYVF